MEDSSLHGEYQVSSSIAVQVVVIPADNGRTTLRLMLLGITRRPVLNPPTPQREFDLSTLPTNILDGTAKTSSNSSLPIVTALPPNAPLRSHLYPMAGALPDSHLPHPLTLVPELDSTSAWTSEILTSTATLIHVILLIRVTVGQVKSKQPVSS